VDTEVTLFPFKGETSGLLAWRCGVALDGHGERVYMGTTSLLMCHIVLCSMRESRRKVHLVSYWARVENSTSCA